jgi:DUF4097 and DUF4098 domain-containing protein YvlB
MDNRIALLLLTAALPLPAQQPRQDLTCNGDGDRGRGESVCEIKEIPLPATGRLMADAGTNGGVTVKGWDKSEVLMRAKLQAWAPSADRARSLAGQIRIQTSGGEIRAEGPENNEDSGWAVSYEIFVPHRTDLALKAHNGGIRIADVSGDIGFETLNGGVTLSQLGGTVKGKTTNGGLRVELHGARWEGNELNVSTQNGGVSMQIPDNYSAQLETGTVNGGMSIDLPITVRGKIGREISTTLGSGGPLIRAYTTNGGISIKRKS